jgi:hypothetical protein
MPMKRMAGCVRADGEDKRKPLQACCDVHAKGVRMSSAAPVRQHSTAEGAIEPELTRIRDVIYQAAGIFHPDNKLRLLQDRCNRRMKDDVHNLVRAIYRA